MATSQNPTPAKELAEQLQHPDPGTIWSRALEVFGDEAKATDWMKTGREIFDGRSPEQLVETGDPSLQRRVLEILLRIEYGVFS
jgi:uncharacterized protein (DUF2384 family)